MLRHGLDLPATATSPDFQAVGLLHRPQAPMTFVTHLECSRCGKRREPGRVHNLCESGGPLLVRYDLDKARGFRAVCLTCHDEDTIRQQRITRTQWSREIDNMMRWGAPAKPEDREAILDYRNNYDPRPR